MSDIKLVHGTDFVDHRGVLTYFDGFDFTGVARYYIIAHDNISTVRGWHGHQFEKKWFQCIQGAFVLSFVKPDNWENPSTNITPETFHINAEEPVLICLPEGYANCIRATIPNSKLLVYSGKPIEEAKLDSWRWAPSMWGGDKI